MISKEKEAEICRLYFAEKWKKGSIARDLGVHHSTVMRVVSVAEPESSSQSQRSSIVDPFRSFIADTLIKYPMITASRVYQMARQRGYAGSPRHFRDIVRMMRRRKVSEAFLRLSTLPGEEAQVDWADFGKIQIGAATRRLFAFVMVLSYSRAIFLRYFPDQSTINFLRGHVAAFRAFGGIPRRILYDNLKSAVLDRRGDAIHFNPQLLSMAAHFCFEPRPVAPYRGNEKGRVERAIRYIRDAFFTALEWRTLDELNDLANDFSTGQALTRPHPRDKSTTVGQALEEDRAALLPLPEQSFPVVERKAVAIGKTPYARFDGNDYSVPCDRVGLCLEVVATMKTVRILDGMTEVARHERSFDKGRTIEDPSHLRDLLTKKRRANRGRALDFLQRSVAGVTEFLQNMAERGSNIGSATLALSKLLEHYGAADLALGVAEAKKRGVFHHWAVRQAIERRRENDASAPLLPLPLQNDPRLQLVVIPHDLKSYEKKEKS